MSLLDVFDASIHSSNIILRGGSPKSPWCVGLVPLTVVSVSLNQNFFGDTSFKGPHCVGLIFFDSFECFFESKLFKDTSFKGPRCAGRGGGFGPYCAAAAAY